ncbi:MAG: TM2 domain-containing protein [Bacteroidaceae bacterium]|nr:TM2 domain-containing protein [Bacteroidaceae bacterium]
MALITCKDCGNQVSDRAQFCPRCGAPVEIENVSGTGTSSHEADEKNCKANEGGVNNGSMSGSNTYLSGQPRYDKTLAGILAIFLGCFGVHHFYVGNNERGISYIVVSLLFMVGYVVVSFVTFGLASFLLPLTNLFVFVVSIIDAIHYFQDTQEQFAERIKKETQPLWRRIY